MSEEKRFRSGFTGVPNALYLANLNDRDALYAFLRFEGDTFFGGLQSVTAYCQILRMGHRRVANLLEIWQREMAQPDLNRISTGSGADVSPATPDSCGESDGQMAGKWRANDRSLLSSTETEQKQTCILTSPPPAGEATPPPDSVPSKAKAKSDSLTARARALWPQLVAEAALGGKVWSEEPGKRQLQIVMERVADSSEQDCIKAVRGYRAKALGADGDWDAMRFFSVTSIFRPRNFDGNVDAAPAESGQSEKQRHEEFLTELRRAKAEFAAKNGGLV
jgi:hypothetical protein